MTYVAPEWIEHQRRRFMRPDAQRYWRPDAERLMSREALKALGWQDPYETHSTAPPLQAHDAWNGFKSEHEWLKHRHDVARLRLDWELFKLWLKARKALHPSNFQPRIPEGNPGGGQWTSGGAAGGLVRLAGPKPPGIGHNSNEGSKIPDERPPTEKERNRVARTVSRNPLLRGPLQILLRLGSLGSAGHWLTEKYHEMKADQDPPKSLEELQDAASNPRPGYDKHHIVLQGPARARGFPEEMIKGRDNEVLIPRYRHWRINEWYETPNESFGGLRPREYLRDKSWEEQRRIGLDALIDVGVLKP